MSGAVLPYNKMLSKTQKRSDVQIIRIARKSHCEFEDDSNNRQFGVNVCHLRLWKRELLWKDVPLPYQEQ